MSVSFFAMELLAQLTDACFDQSLLWSIGVLSIAMDALCIVGVAMRSFGEAKMWDQFGCYLFWCDSIR